MEADIEGEKDADGDCEALIDGLKLAEILGDKEGLKLAEIDAD